LYIPVAFVNNAQLRWRIAKTWVVITSHGFALTALMALKVDIVLVFNTGPRVFH
jgi:hypothetical protein